MNIPKLSLLIILAALLTNRGFSQSELILSASYETIGLTVLLDNNDQEGDAYANVEYRQSSSNQWVLGFPVSRVNNNLDMCSGSIFWLLPNTSYDVRVEIIDATTSALNGQILQGTVTTKSEPNFQTGSGVTLYVNTTGSDGNYNLQAAINIAQAGDLILLDSGTYYVGNITFPNNGSLLNPIRIEGVNKEYVILNGAYETPHVWTPYGAGGVYQTTTSALNPNLIIADGVRLFPHQTYPELRENKIILSYAPLREYPAEVGGFYRNSTMLPWANFDDPIAINPNKLYIKFLDGSDPNDKNIEITKQAYCFKLEGNEHINIRNLTFKNYGLGHIATAIIVSNSNNITIDSCDFKANNTSVKLSGNANNILIQNCDFKDYFFNWTAWKIKSTQDIETIFNSRFPLNSRNLERGSLIFAHDFYGDNIVFRRNNIADYHQGGHISPDPPASSVLDTMRKSLEIDFYDNTIINCRGDGFEIDGFARNVRVFRNTFDGCHAALSLATAEEGPLYIMRNTFSNIIPDFYDNGYELVQAKGHPLKFQVGGNKINGDIYFYHNTVDAQNIAFGMNVYQTTTQNAWKRLDSKNNIFTTDFGIGLNVITISGMPNFTSDYNNYFSNNPNISCVSFDNSTPNCYSNLEELFANYGWEQHSLQTDPEFEGAANGNYNLSSTSPLIDLGIIIQGINENDFNGVNPDMGAFEADSPVFVSEMKNEEIKIYPNPANRFLNMELVNTDGDWTYSIFDIYGKLILTSKVSDRNTVIDITGLASGTYVIQLVNKHRIISKKLIKSR